MSLAARSERFTRSFRLVPSADNPGVQRQEGCQKVRKWGEDAVSSSSIQRLVFFVGLRRKEQLKQVPHVRHRHGRKLVVLRY